MPSRSLSYLEGRRGTDERSTISFFSVLAWLFLSSDWFQKQKFPSSLPSPLKSQLQVPILFLCVITSNHEPQEYSNHQIGPAYFTFIGFIFSHATITVSASWKAGGIHSKKEPRWEHVDRKVEYVHFSVYNNLDRVISSLFLGYQIKLIYKIYHC